MDTITCYMYFTYTCMDPWSVKVIIASSVCVMRQSNDDVDCWSISGARMPAGGCSHGPRGGDATTWRCGAARLALESGRRIKNRSTALGTMVGIQSSRRYHSSSVKWFVAYASPSMLKNRRRPQRIAKAEQHIAIDVFRRHTIRLNLAV